MGPEWLLDLEQSHLILEARFFVLFSLPWGFLVRLRT
jgi:hypothetical protein